MVSSTSLQALVQIQLAEAGSPITWTSTKWPLPVKKQPDALSSKLPTGNLKRVSLELGGKALNIVFVDADIDAAVKGAITGIFFNQGQVCCAGSRLFLEKSIHDEFMSKLTDRVAKMRQGNGMDDGVQIGPQVSKEQQERILSYVGIAQGRRRQAGLRWSRSFGAQEGLLRPTDYLHRCQQRHAHRQRRSLRTGPGCYPLHLHG